jgi:hypothetical protein
MAETNPDVCIDLFVETIVDNKLSIIQNKLNNSKKININTEPLSLRQYGVPLDALRYTDKLRSNFLGEHKYGIQNLRYQKWDLRFLIDESAVDPAFLYLMFMPINKLYYDYKQVCKSLKINPLTKTKYINLHADYWMGFPVSEQNKKIIKTMFTLKKKELIKFSKRSQIKIETKPTHPAYNLNLKKFDNIRKILHSQYKKLKVPESIKKKIVKSIKDLYIKETRTSINISSLIYTDFYTICRMFSEFDEKKLTRKSNPPGCRKKENKYTKNIIYYGGSHHSVGITLVLERVFGITEGYDFVSHKEHFYDEFNHVYSKIIKVKDLKKDYLKTPFKNFYEVLKPFYGE